MFTKCIIVVLLSEATPAKTEICFWNRISLQLESWSFKGRPEELRNSMLALTDNMLCILVRDCSDCFYWLKVSLFKLMSRFLGPIQWNEMSASQTRVRSPWWWPLMLYRPFMWGLMVSDIWLLKWWCVSRWWWWRRGTSPRSQLDSGDIYRREHEVMTFHELWGRTQTCVGNVCRWDLKWCFGGIRLVGWFFPVLWRSSLPAVCCTLKECGAGLRWLHFPTCGF